MKQRSEIGPAPTLCGEAIPGCDTAAHQDSCRDEEIVDPVKPLSTYHSENSSYSDGDRVLRLVASC